MTDKEILITIQNAAHSAMVRDLEGFKIDPDTFMECIDDAIELIEKMESADQSKHEQEEISCPHGRASGQACPHCLGVNR